jgi:hypothetical protein
VPTVANQHCGTDVPDCVATGGCSGATTGTTTGGATTTGGLSGGSTGGAQGTTGATNPPVTCPKLTGSNAGAAAGPMKKGCPVAAGNNGGGALAFTGLNALILLGIAALTVGFGLALTTVGNLRRRPRM